MQINFMSNVCKVFLIAISNQNALTVLIKIKKQINEWQKNTETVFAWPFLELASQYSSSNLEICYFSHCWKGAESATIIISGFYRILL